MALALSSEVAVNMQSRTASGIAAATSAPFPFLDLQAEYALMAPDILSAVEKVLRSQQFILGPEVGELEREVAKLAGCRFAVACASGTDALLLSLMALGVGPGDEVITTPFTFVATAGSVAQLQARPVFVDIDPETFNLDWRQVENAIGPRTKAVLPVHLFGMPAAMTEIVAVARKHGIPVVEDAAQAIGARHGDQPVGSIGLCGCFSFFPSKNLGAAGDGGMVTSNNAEFAERLSTLRTHGSRRKYHYDLLGINSRLDTLQAAILLVKLRYLETFTHARQQHAERYRRLLAAAGLESRVRCPQPPSKGTHVYHQFVIRVNERDALQEHLRARGVPSAVYYPSPLHLEPAFAFLGYEQKSFPQAEAACQQALALPVSPQMTEAQQQHVIDSIANFFAARP